MNYKRLYKRTRRAIEQAARTQGEIINREMEAGNYEHMEAFLASYAAFTSAIVVMDWYEEEARAVAKAKKKAATA